jgi:RNA-dependent RNA polymerase
MIYQNCHLTYRLVIGTLILPSRETGRIFLDWLHQGNYINVHGNKLKFCTVPRGSKVPEKLKMTLKKAPYVDPDLDEQRQIVLRNLNHALRIDEVQVGVFHYVKGRGLSCHPCFSIEWRKTYEETMAMLPFEYNKLIRIQVCPVIFAILSTLLQHGPL